MRGLYGSSRCGGEYVRWYADVQRGPIPGDLTLATWPGICTGFGTPKKGTGSLLSGMQEGEQLRSALVSWPITAAVIAA